MQPIMSNVQWKTNQHGTVIRYSTGRHRFKCRECCPPQAVRSDQEINQIEWFKIYSRPDIWIWWSNILQNINESELYFGQLDQSTEQTICNIHTYIIMKQTNPFCTEAFSENSFLIVHIIEVQSIKWTNEYTDDESKTMIKKFYQTYKPMNIN